MAAPAAPQLVTLRAIAAVALPIIELKKKSPAVFLTQSWRKNHTIGQFQILLSQHWNK
jgi:hypothetical protein